MARNLTQSELASRASVDKATVQRLEGGRKVHFRNLKKICDALHESIEFVSSTLPYGRPQRERQLFIHRDAELSWFAGGDRRRKIPTDSHDRIQKEEERLRLGRAGLVSSFQAYAFSMPDGPGMSVSEIYERVPWGPNRSYRDCITYCTRGEVLLTIKGETIHLCQGDGVGHSAQEDATVEPVRPVDREGKPPVVMYVAANRIGHLPIAFKGKRRLRARLPKVSGA